jgi:hypothetical protein
MYGVVNRSKTRSRLKKREGKLFHITSERERGKPANTSKEDFPSAYKKMSCCVSENERGKHSKRE